MRVESISGPQFSGKKERNRAVLCILCSVQSTRLLAGDMHVRVDRRVTSPAITDYSMADK